MRSRDIRAWDSELCRDFDLEALIAPCNPSNVCVKDFPVVLRSWSSGGGVDRCRRFRVIA